MTEARKGIWSLNTACTVWGLSPIYYPALAAPALEVLAHPTLWSLMVFGLVLTAQRQLPDLVRFLTGRHAGRVAPGE